MQNDSTSLHQRICDFAWNFVCLHSTEGLDDLLTMDNSQFDYLLLCIKYHNILEFAADHALRIAQAQHPYLNSCNTFAHNFFFLYFRVFFGVGY